jgi:hypothetical protein
MSSRREIAAAILSRMRPRSKYRNERTEYNGVWYASKEEALRAFQLDVMLRAGTIQRWRRQPKYHLGVPENVYVADFLVTGLDGIEWTEDVKGHETSKFKRDKNLWRAYGPHELKVIRGRRVVETIPGGHSGQ